MSELTKPEPKLAEADDEQGRYTVPALQRGLQLLMQFNRQQREMTGADLARATGWPRASVFRMLQTLEQMGFVERMHDGVHFRLGLAVLRLGFEAVASIDLVEHAQPVLQRLRDATQLSAHLVLRDGAEAVFVAKAAAPTSLMGGVQVGARLPLHATVIGRVLMFDWSPEDMARTLGPEPYAAFTPVTPISLAALQERLRTERGQGYAISEGGFEAGISTVAAPVLDGARKVCAALSVTVQSGRIEAADKAVLAAKVLDAAATLSASHAPSP